VRRAATGEKTYDERTPCQLPFPNEAQQEIVIPHAIPEDERVGVRQTENVWFRPLCLNRSQGYWMTQFAGARGRGSCRGIGIHSPYTALC